MKSVEELTKAQNDLIDEIQTFAESNNLASEEICPIYDGVADIEAYLKSSLKIMWILKESYDDDGGGWYLGDVWDGEKKEKDSWKNQTWKGMSYALYGFRNNLYWSELPAIRQNKNMLDELKSIAYINMSKMPGTRQTSDTQARLYYNTWKDIIYKQINLYEPDVIVFGGTFKFFYNPSELETSKQECIENTDANKNTRAIIYKYNGKWLISTQHPSRYGEVYIDCLIDALKYVENRK